MLYFVSGRIAPGEPDGDGSIQGDGVPGGFRVCGSREDTLLNAALDGEVGVMCPGACRTFRLISGSIQDGRVHGSFIAEEIPFGEFLGACGHRMVRAGNYPVLLRGNDGSLVTFSLGGRVELRVHADGSWDRKCPAEGWVVTAGGPEGVSEQCEVHGDVSVAEGCMGGPIAGRMK